MQEPLQQVKNVFLLVLQCALSNPNVEKSKNVHHFSAKNTYSTWNLNVLNRNKFISSAWIYQLLAAILTLRMNWLGCWYGVGKLFLTATAGHSWSSSPEILEIRNINWDQSTKKKYGFYLQMFRILTSTLGRLKYFTVSLVLYTLWCLTVACLLLFSNFSICHGVLNTVKAQDATYPTVWRRNLTKHNTHVRTL